MTEWKQLISRANELYFSGHKRAAERLYCKALAVAERQLAYCKDKQDAVAAFISSHRNLADFYQNNNQMYEACLRFASQHIETQIYPDRRGLSLDITLKYVLGEDEESKNPGKIMNVTIIPADAATCFLVGNRLSHSIPLLKMDFGVTYTVHCQRKQGDTSSIMVTVITSAGPPT